MGDLNRWWDRYGLKLLALIAAALIIGAVYPQLASRSQNPSQLSAWDSDWNDLSRFAADMEARGYTTQSLLSTAIVEHDGRPVAIPEVLNTPYINTIPASAEQPVSDEHWERVIEMSGGRVLSKLTRRSSTATTSMTEILSSRTAAH